MKSRISGFITHPNTLMAGMLSAMNIGLAVAVYNRAESIYRPTSNEQQAAQRELSTLTDSTLDRAQLTRIAEGRITDPQSYYVTVAGIPLICSMMSLALFGMYDSMAGGSVVNTRNSKR